MKDEFTRTDVCEERHKGLDARLDGLKDGQLTLYKAIEKINRKLDKNGNNMIWKILAIMTAFAVGIISVVSQMVK